MYITPNLTSFEDRISSQQGEDGVVRRISSDLGIKQGTFFEFGIGPRWLHPETDPLEGNFVELRKQGWSGVFLDGHDRHPMHDVKKEFVTALSINQIYRKYRLPENLDFMSIDVDGQEFWLWMALDYKPKVMVIEYSGFLPQGDSITVPFDLHFSWDGTTWCGATLFAMVRLGYAKEYTLIYANGVNAFFIRNDLISNKQDFNFEKIVASTKGHVPQHAPDPHNRPFVKI